MRDITAIVIAVTAAIVVYAAADYVSRRWSSTVSTADADDVVKEAERIKDTK